MFGDVSTDVAVLRSLGGRNLLFSEANQEIYELDELTAFVWQSLETGLSSGDAVADLVAAGVHSDAATQAVEQALIQLRPIQRARAQAPQPAVRPTTTLEPRAKDTLASLTVKIPGASVIELQLSEALVPPVINTLGYLLSDNQPSDCRIVARSTDETIEFYPPDKPMWDCNPADFVATLKAELLEQVLRLATYEIALHTAALVRNGKALLIAGPPGAGKSTLALALSRAGWELAADDVVLVNQDGLIRGLPFPLTAKSSSWPLIDHHWPELASNPTFHRPDGFDVRYLTPEQVAPPRPWESGAFVVLDRRAGVAAQIKNVEPADMLGTLISEATSRDQRLTARGFSALVTSLDKARCAKLTYSDLFEGVEALDEVGA